MVRKIAIWFVLVIAGLAVLTYAAFQLSPWPMALIIRHSFNKGASEAAAALEKHVPPGIGEKPDIPYAPNDPDALLDVYFPKTLKPGEALPTIVWVHGGAWISGDKRDVANYLRKLTKHGYTTVSVGYSIAPGAIYPTPVKQVLAALKYLSASKGLHVDNTRIMLAGDSAGAQIASQVANIVSDPSYARLTGFIPTLRREQLKGVLLFCGAYDVALADLNGPFGGFLRTVLWSYSGTKHFESDGKFAQLSVAKYVTASFPPAFISAGNADPLGPQSVAMASALKAQGVPVDTLFFLREYKPELGHEYQFNLDSEAGQLALKRALAFTGKQLKGT